MTIWIHEYFTWLLCVNRNRPRYKSCLSVCPCVLQQYFNTVIRLPVYFSTSGLPQEDCLEIYFWTSVSKF